MTRKLLIRGGLVAAILIGVALIVFRGEPSKRDGWRDCSAPQLTETLPVDDSVSLTVDLEAVSSVQGPVTMLDLGDSLLVGTQQGEVIDTATGEVVLDLTDQVAVGAERGLLDLELSPDERWLYVSYTEAPDGHSRVRAWPWNGAELTVADGVDIASLEQPHRMHNGGGMVFGPDGSLYLGFGDGGSDVLPEPERARDLSNWYGSIIRIDPTPEAGGYEVPDDNPFVDDSDAAPEILHYGLRNPWRFSFDQEGQLWIADVGHFCVEEVDLAGPDAAGLDFGWPGLEGTYEWALEESDDATPPVYEYLHEGLFEDKVTCSISGGEVYSGSAIPDLQGVYVFTDFCDGELRGIEITDGGVIEYHLGVAVESPVAVLSDDEGELHVMSFEDGGKITRIVPRR